MKNQSVNSDSDANSNTRGFDETDMFDFVGTVRFFGDSIRFNINLILLTTALVLGLAFTYHMVWPPVYTAEAVIMVERSEDTQRDAFYQEWNVFRKGDARTEVGLIDSGAIIRRVIEAENLSYDDVYHPLMSQLKYFWEESWLGRGYNRVKEIFFGPREADILLTKEQQELGKTVEDMKSAISVEIAGDLLMANILTRGPSARISDITNTWMDTYLDWRKEQGILEARDALESLDRQLDRVNAEIQETSEKRVEFLRTHNLVFDFNKEAMQIEKIVELETAIAATERRISVINSSLQDIRSQLQSEPEQRVVSSIVELNDLRETAKKKRLELESTLIRDLYRFRSDSPEIARLRAQIEDLDKLIQDNPETLERGKTLSTNPIRAELLMRQSSLQTEHEGLVAELEGMNRQLKEMNEALTTAPALLAELLDLDRRYAVAQQVYQVLLTKRSQADVSLVAQESAAPTVRIVDYAAPVAGKSWPTAKILYPVALVLGIVLGMFAAVVKHLFSGRISLGHMQESRYGLPLLAVLDVDAGLHQQPVYNNDNLSPAVNSARHKTL